MKRLTSDQVYKLPIGSIFYYEEYEPGQGTQMFADIVEVSELTEYNGPKLRVIFGMLNKTGDERYSNAFEIENGRAKAISDKKYITKLVFER